VRYFNTQDHARAWGESRELCHLGRAVEREAVDSARVGRRKVGVAYCSLCALPPAGIDTRSPGADAGADCMSFLLLLILLVGLGGWLDARLPWPRA
jgi:hypothetical protein